MVPMVRVPPRTGAPLPTPGFEPVAAVVDEAVEGPEEHPASSEEAPAPRTTAPPAAALRVKKDRRLRPLSDVTELSHRSPPARCRFLLVVARSMHSATQRPCCEGTLLPRGTGVHGCARPTTVPLALDTMPPWMRQRVAHRQWSRPTRSP